MFYCYEHYMSISHMALIVAMEHIYIYIYIYMRINFYLLRTFCPHLGGFLFVCCFFFHYVSAKFHLWPSSGDLP